MKEDSDVISERERRKKRVRLYKRIILILLFSIIILPTILCIILFVKLNRMNDRISKLSALIEQESTYNSGAIEDDTDLNPTSGDNHDEDVTSDEDASGTTEPSETEPETETDEEPQSTEAPTDPANTQNTPGPGEKELVAQALAEGRKVVYLTFDDGPYNNTDNLLDLLAKYNIKATFFVVGNNKIYSEKLQRIVNEGHSIGIHTVTHDYAKIYASVDALAEEIYAMQDYIFQVTGYKTYLFRFPGGSSNSKTKIPISEFTSFLNENGFTYFDWNVSSGDGGSVISADDVYNNVMNGLSKVQSAVVLMHDSQGKLTTYEALPRLIEALQAQNALILPITEDTVPVHHR